MDTIGWAREAVLVTAWQVLGPVVLLGWLTRFVIATFTVRWGGARPRSWYRAHTYLTLLAVAVLAGNTMAMHKHCDKAGAERDCRAQFMADRSLFRIIN